MTTPLAEPVADNAGVRLGVIELARVIGFAGMVLGVCAGAALTLMALHGSHLVGAVGGVLLAAASSCFDLFGEGVLVRLLTRRFERRGGSSLRGGGAVHALVNVEPEATARSVKRVPDDIAVLELVPKSGRLAFEGVLGRAEVRAEAQPIIHARKDQLWPVVELRYADGDVRYDLVLYQHPSFARTMAVLFGLLGLVRHPSDRLADRMRRALEGVALPGRNVPEAASDEAPVTPAPGAPRERER
ncbi:MAG: hypothetical protein IT383_15005 [Deltaproteobacteria bacterium]|nr:hypothetical protein [Deltaproteobacteria bacterium]